MRKSNNNTALKDVLAISFGINIVALFIDNNFYLILANAIFLLLCLEITQLRNAVSGGWRAFAHALGLINSTIILSLIFFLVLFPVSMLKKLFTGSKKQSNETSLITINKQYSAKDLENLW